MRPDRTRPRRVAARAWSTPRPLWWRLRPAATKRRSCARFSGLIWICHQLDTTSSTWQASSRGRRAGLFQLSCRRAIELRVQDRIVDGREARAFGQRRLRRPGGAQGDSSADHDEPQPSLTIRTSYGWQRAPSREPLLHMLVRSCCFSPWRSRASAISRSTRRGNSRPLAAQSFAYMPMVVKPGIVLTSLRYRTPLSRGEQEVDARHAGAVNRLERRDRQRAGPRRPARR